MLIYGIQVGLAGAVGAAIGYALGVDHPGWASATALLVSRPDRSLLRARGVGRIVSVLTGAIVACTLAATQPLNAVYALILVLMLAGAAATSGSRWFCSTAIVLSMLLLGEDESPEHWFVERIALTVVGVALAAASVWLVPALARLVRGRTHEPVDGSHNDA